MAQLYLEEYSRNLSGKRVGIACREGILRDTFGDIVADIKFLNRFTIQTVLYHNLPNRFANQKLIRELEQKLPRTTLVRIAPDSDFYEAVLTHTEKFFLSKLIFLERRYLCDTQEQPINSFTTERLRQLMIDAEDFVGNVNFRNALGKICEKIEQNLCERVHILPAGKNTIKHELFTVEGSGTIIANNFQEEFRQVISDEDVAIVNRILSMYKRTGFLKPRSKDYVDRHRNRFFVTAIDGIIVGCVEQKIIDEQTVELGALAISTRFKNQRIGLYTVRAFLQKMQEMGYKRFISLTSNPKLQALFVKLDFEKAPEDLHPQRQAQSPGVTMFVKYA